MHEPPATVVSVRELSCVGKGNIRMSTPLANQLQELAINKSHWKELKFMENFLAETGGRGISEFHYGGCVGTYGDDNEEDTSNKRND